MQLARGGGANWDAGGREGYAADRERCAALLNHRGVRQKYRRDREAGIHTAARTQRPCAAVEASRQHSDAL